MWRVAPHRVVAAAPEHLASLPLIEAKAGQLFPDTHVPERLREIVTPPEAFARAAREQRLFVAVAARDEAVGFALAGVMDGAAYLAELDVLPEHGRRGIGRDLIEAVKLWAAQGGFPALLLVTFKDLPWNAPYYLRLGFEALAPDAHTPALQAVLQREAAAGLDASRRVAMRARVEPAGPAPLRYVTRAGVANAELNALFGAAWPAHRERDFEATFAQSLLYVTAHAGPRLVGFVNLAWDGGLHGFVLDPTVHPDWRLRGVGSELMRLVIAGARDKGLEWLHVDYEPGLERFYRRSGFTSSEAGVLRL